MQLLFLHPLISEEVLRAIGWTLIHSLWQGLLAAVLAGIVIALTRRSAARIRYNLLALVLSLFLVTTLVTFCLQKEKSTGEKSDARLTGTRTETRFFPPDTHYEAAVVETTTAMDRFVAYFNTHADLFVLIWALFFFIHCIKLLTGLAGIQRLRTYKTHLPAKEWQAKLNQLSKAIDLRLSISLLESELVKIPAAIGYLRPVILVPLGLLSNLPADQVEAILLHELAHIRRKDYIMNILQRFTEAVFFFNPALLWISSLIRQEREACCDDIVIADTHHKGSYLDALVSFQEYSIAASGYAMGISSKKHYLLSRVKRMLTRENKKLNLMEKILLIAGLVVVTAFTFIPQKEIVVKKQPHTRINEKTRVEIATPAAPASPAKPVVRKEKNKPVLMTLTTDTIPAPVKEKEKANYDDMKFPGISHNTNINDDGKTKTETITITNEDGKTYKITKLNNKVTTLAIDGKNIPENDIANYKPLLEKIDRVIDENRAGRQKEMEARKAEMQKRQEAMNAQMAERHEKMEMYNKERMKQREDQMKQLDIQRKALEKQREKMMKDAGDNKVKRDEYEKQLNREKRELDEERKQLIHESEQDNQKNRMEYRKQMDDERKQMIKEAESDSHKKDENKKQSGREKEYRKESDLGRKMHEDVRNEMMKKAEKFSKKGVYVDSTGREIIKFDTRKEDVRVTDSRKKADACNETGKNLLKNPDDFKKDLLINTRIDLNANSKLFTDFKYNNLFKVNLQDSHGPKFILNGPLWKPTPEWKPSTPGWKPPKDTQSPKPTKAPVKISQKLVTT